MKKFLSMTLTLIMLMALAVPAFAVDTVPATDSNPEENWIMATDGFPIEIGPHPGKEKISANANTEIEYDKILNEMIRTRIETYIPTEEDYTKAQDILAIYEQVNSSLDGNIATLSGFDENWQKLRYGNLIELSLDYDEGITNLVAARCFVLSRNAEKEAKDNFPNYWDSAQHFMWNFMMADEESKNTARTIANNHEWGIAMIKPMLNYFESKYDKYIADGYSENDASSKALADTIVYMPVFKYDAVCVIEASYDFFKKFFSEESIMDLWNNCYGRAYPEKGYTNAVNAFNYAAFTKGEIVLDGKKSMAENLAERHIKSVWEWDWYSY